MVYILEILSLADFRHLGLLCDEDEMESYRSVVSTPKKAKKANTFHSTQIVPTDQDFRPGDFVVLRDESNQDQVCKSTFLIKITEQIRYTTAIENE